MKPLPIDPAPARGAEESSLPGASPVPGAPPTCSVPGCEELPEDHYHPAVNVHLERAIAIIEAADGRAAAADGPVGHVRDEMTDNEWRELYISLQKARR